MEPLLTIILIALAGGFIGSFIGVIKRPSDTIMFNMLSFAAGVMLAISFLELIPESLEISSIAICSAGIFAGALMMFAVDKLIPHMHPGLCADENLDMPGYCPARMQGMEEGRGRGRNQMQRLQKRMQRLKRTATYLLFGIFMHNFPEGLAIGIGAVSGSAGGYNMSFIIALAIAIHDIPEGICTSAPYFYVTGKRLRSFLVSFSTAIPTVAGILFAYFLFPLVSMKFVGFLVAATAGLMIYISGDELIPVSCSRMTQHSTIFSFILGVISVVLLGLL